MMLAHLNYDAGSPNRTNMSYNYDLVFSEIKKALLHAPNSSLKEIERRLGIERHTLKRVVRSVARKTFREFHRDARLSKARELMAEVPARSLKEISYTLGFNSPRSFGRFIKEATGDSPTTLRRFVRNNQFDS